MKPQHVFIGQLFINYGLNLGLLESSTLSVELMKRPFLISYPNLTLSVAEMWDLEKFSTMPYFIGYCE